MRISLSHAVCHSITFFFPLKKSSGKGKDGIFPDLELPVLVALFICSSGGKLPQLRPEKLQSTAVVLPQSSTLLHVSSLAVL